MMSSAADYLKNRKPGRPVFMFLFLNSTHFPYAYKQEFAFHKPDSAPGVKLALDNKIQFNRYRNSVRYIDSLFGKLISNLRSQSSKEEWIVAFAGDHGEAFGEHGYTGMLSIASKTR